MNGLAPSIMSNKKISAPTISPYGFKSNIPTLPVSTENTFTDRISQGNAGAGFGSYPIGYSPAEKSRIFNAAVIRANAGKTTAVNNINENYAQMGLGNSGAKGQALTMADLSRLSDTQDTLTDMNLQDANLRLQNEQKRQELQSNFDLSSQARMDNLIGQSQNQENWNKTFNMEEALKQWDLSQQEAEAQRMAAKDQFMMPYEQAQVARNNSIANAQWRMAMQANRSTPSYPRL